MAGNVREWTRDSWGMYTADAQVDPTTKVDNPAIRVVRGGGYEQTATHLRSTTRGPVAASAGGLSSGLGFRCVKPVGCTTDGDCDDGKACTKDLCQAGACKTSLSPCGLNATCSEPDGKCTCGTGFVGDGQTCKCGPQMVAIDVDGKTVCAPDYPVWGIRPESPPAEWFKDNGDGTVGDTQSKLVWQKEDSGDTKDWAGAKGYCQGLALGSKSDWRLPTRAEVLTLVDFGKAVPVIVPPFVGSLSTPSYFWTSGAFLGAVGQAWAVSTDHGGSYFFPGTTQNRVRCVRSPASESLGDRYTIDAAQGTVHDASTKMTWQRDGGTGGMASWADANGYCQGLQLAGGSWRLPSIVELQSLVNAQLSGTAIDPVVFPSVQTPGATWSSTGVTVGTGDTWIVNFLVGYSGNIKAIVKDVRVRCTRGPVCIADAECDDGNACTVDACKDGACTHTPAGDGLPCGDAMECGAGVCYPKPPQGMALIPAATFWMGCNAVKDKNCADNEKPQHKVTLSAYFMDETETTVGQYKACVDAKVCTAPSYVQPAQYATYPGLTNNPVTMVTWTQSRAYCKWRGAAYDLPTEAQWEMAARGSCEKNGSTAGDAACAAAMRTYPWGEATATCSYAVMKDGDGPNGCGTNATWEVAKKTEGDSPYGLHDMAGNVFEWNRDWYDSYTPGAQTDPSGPGGGADRVGRGGGFGYGAAPLRSGSRYVGFSPSTASGSIGLRCVKSYP
jgi:iron(II)-dependent oxidoreductase